VYLNKFEPEYLDSFEIGTKTVALDRRLTVNLAFFFGLYDNIQTLALVDITEVGAALPSQHLVTLNAAEATTRGAELEIMARPADGLQLSGTIGYVDTKYNKFDEAINDMTGESFYDRSGESFNSTPSLQTHVSVQYSFELPNGWLTPRLDWYYQSSVHYAGPEVNATNQAGYNLLHARLSYDFLDDRAQVALWGQNLTDQTYARWGMASTVPSWGNAIRYYGPPRTFGAEFSYRF
jgi:iron complex outermembrane receptor protein